MIFRTFSSYRVAMGKTLNRQWPKTGLFHFSLKKCSNFLQLWQNLIYFIFKRARKSIDYHFLDSVGRYLVNHYIVLSWTNHCFSRRPKHKFKHTFKKMSILALNHACIILDWQQLGFFVRNTCPRTVIFTRQKKIHRNIKKSNFFQVELKLFDELDLCD